MLENIFWIMSYISGLFMFLCSLVFSWFLLKDILKKFHYRQILFAIGLLAFSFIVLYVDMANLRLYPVWAIAISVMSFVFITAALSKKLWQYLLIASVSALYLFPSNDHIIYYLSITAGLALAFLAYKNMYALILEKRMGNRDIDDILARSDWGLLFVALAVMSFSYTLVTIPNIGAPLYVLLAIGIVSKVVFGIVIFRYLLNFANFKYAEKIIITISVCIISIVVSMNVVLSYWTQEVLARQLKEVVHSEIHASYELAIRSFPDGELVDLMKNNDKKLISYVDQIYATTKIRTTLFLGDERIAANPSLATNIRPLGTKISSQSVRENVLIKGEEYTGQVFTNGQIVIASYLPIYDGDTIIGMIGTGREIGHITSIENQLMIFYGVMALGFTVLATTAMIYVKPGKALNK